MKITKWVSADPVDRFWQLVRMVVEEGQNRYGLELYVSVESRDDRLSAYLASQGHTGGFSFPITYLADAVFPPEHPLEAEVWPLLREFASKRDLYG